MNDQAGKHWERLSYRCEVCDREITREEYEHLTADEAMACPDHPQATILSCPEGVRREQRSKAARVLGRDSAAKAGRAGRGAAKRRTNMSYRCEVCDREITREEYEHLTADEAMACPDHPQATILSCPEPATPEAVSARMRDVRAKRRYAVSIQYASGEIAFPTALATLAAAKATAREAWDHRPGMCVTIRCGTRSWEASQTHGAGMLWR